MDLENNELLRVATNSYNKVFGFRRIGDAVIASKEQSYKYPNPKEFEMNLICQAPKDQIITFIKIKVATNSPEAEARIVKGGYNEDFIEILITASCTCRLELDAKFYGMAKVPPVE